MTVTASKLREDVYNLLDRVLATGQPLVVERKGRQLTIAPVAPVGKLDRLPRRQVLRGSPESMVHLDWSKEWRRDLP